MFTEGSSEVIQTAEYTLSQLPGLIYHHAAKAAAANRRLLIVTDLDYTVTDAYLHDEKIRHDIPVFDTDTRVAFANAVPPVLIASGRTPLETAVQQDVAGLLHGRDLPMILENGGVLYVPNAVEGPRLIPLATREQLDAIAGVKQALVERIHDFPHSSDEELLLRLERVTNLEIRLQARTGEVSSHERYLDLMEYIRLITRIDGLHMTHAGAALCIEADGINKQTGIEAALAHMGISRNDVYILGFGDARNDEGLFRAADFGVAVRRAAAPYADAFVDAGPAVLRRTLEVFSSVTE